MKIRSSAFRRVICLAIPVMALTVVVSPNFSYGVVRPVTEVQEATENEDGKSDPDTASKDADLFHWQAGDEEADSQWLFKDPEAWKFEEIDGQRVLSQFQKASSYSPPHRSPTHMALLKDKKFGSFQLDVKLKSTHEDYGHRDVCLYFGYQDPARFYYVHMAKEADPRANQIFIVNKADRTKITEKTTEGTDWDEQWHHVRIKRNVESGLIEIYFDDMKNPIMKATDKNFQEGQIGFGSFDDTAAFKELTIRKLEK